VLPLIGCAAIALLVYLNAKRARSKRQAFIDNYNFTAHQYARVQLTYPHLSDVHMTLLARGLKTFFSAHLHAPKAVHAMPSKAVDAMWHAFILDTRAYQSFCQHAFGRYFHHIPGSRMDEAKDNDAAMERMWRFACSEQDLPPARSARLPALFALDLALGIPNGFSHSAHELAQLSKRVDERTASGDDSGVSGGSGCSDGSSGCGGGCGGGGCGG
jgi:hypothetical protein